MKRRESYWGKTIAATFIIAGFSFAVMLLWNWLMPAVFGLPPVNFWQALGLLLLSRIFFGRRVGMMRNSGNPIHQRWMRMTPGERKEFIGKWRSGHDHRWGFSYENKTDD